MSTFLSAEITVPTDNMLFAVAIMISPKTCTHESETTRFYKETVYDTFSQKFPST